MNYIINLFSIIGAIPAVSTDKVNPDVNTYFNSHPGSNYPIDSGVQLLANQISIELESQSSHAILLIRISLIIKIIFWYVICFSWIAYASLKQIKIHSSHSISAQG